MAKNPQEAPAAEAVAPKKKGKKLILVAGVLTLALGGGGAGAWYFMRPADANAVQAPEPEKPAQFLTLESFTVNLVSSEGASQYLQAGLSLKLGHDVKIEVVKDRMPEIRNRILLVLSGKKASELLPVAGKQKLAAELSDSIREILGDSAGLKPAAKTAAKAKPEAEVAETKEAQKDGEAAKADAEPKAEGKEQSKPAATHVVKNEVEVLFTSFIIQ